MCSRSGASLNPDSVAHGWRGVHLAHEKGSRLDEVKLNLVHFVRQHREHLVQVKLQGLCLIVQGL